MTVTGASKATSTWMVSSWFRPAVPEHRVDAFVRGRDFRTFRSDRDLADTLQRGCQSVR